MQKEGNLRRGREGCSIENGFYLYITSIKGRGSLNGDFRRDSKRVREGGRSC